MSFDLDQARHFVGLIKIQPVGKSDQQMKTKAFTANRPKAKLEQNNGLDAILLGVRK